MFPSLLSVCCLAPEPTRIPINSALFQQVIPPTGLVCLDTEIQLSKWLPDFLWDSWALCLEDSPRPWCGLWEQIKYPAEGCAFAHYWKQFRKHMASLPTTDEPSTFPLIAQETGQVHTVNYPPPPCRSARDYRIEYSVFKSCCTCRSHHSQRV